VQASESFTHHFATTPAVILPRRALTAIGESEILLYIIQRDISIAQAHSLADSSAAQ
jgi:hypothetical protein